MKILLMGMVAFVLQGVFFTAVVHSAGERTLRYLHASATIFVCLPVAFTHLLDESLERYMVALLEQFTRILYSCSGETPSSEILASRLYILGLVETTTLERMFT